MACPFWMSTRPVPSWSSSAAWPRALRGSTTPSTISIRRSCYSETRSLLWAPSCASLVAASSSCALPGVDQRSISLTSLGILPSSPSFGVVKDDAQGIARASMHAADPMPQIHPIVPASAFHRTITSGENDRLALIRMDHFGSGLSPRLLFHQDKFSAVPIATVLAKHENHLQREAHLSINVLMEAVVTARLIMQQQRRGFCLPGPAADSQEGGVILGVSETRHTQRLGPAIRDPGEMRVGFRPQIRDQFGERMAEVFVIADAEPIALHDDLTAKAALIFIQCRERCTFGGRENRVHDRVSAVGERFLRSLPIQGVHSFADRKNLRNPSSCLWHAFPREPRMQADQSYSLEHTAHRIYPICAVKFVL